MNRREIAHFPAGDPRADHRAEQTAAEQRAQGVDAKVVFNTQRDAFRVVVDEVIR